MDWFTSDLHIGHELVRRTRGFKTLEEMKEKIYSMFDVVEKGDRVFILGDIAWDTENAQELINYLIFKKKVSDLYIIEGNHDVTKWLGKIKTHPRLHIHQTMYVKSQKGFGYNSLFLSHYPHIVYNKSHHGTYQLHGHGHVDTTDRPILDKLLFGKRINVCCEFYNYTLLSRQDIEDMMSVKPDNLDYVLLHGNEKQKEYVMKALKDIDYILRRMYDSIEAEGPIVESYHNPLEISK